MQRVILFTTYGLYSSFRSKYLLNDIYNSFFVRFCIMHPVNPHHFHAETAHLDKKYANEEPDSRRCIELIWLYITFFLCFLAHLKT